MNNEETNLIECLDCNGRGFFQAAFKPISIPCRRCGESGRIPAIQAFWHQDGQKYRQERLDRRETMRDASKRLNIVLLVLSDAEQGRINPHPILKDTAP